MGICEETDKNKKIIKKEENNIKKNKDDYNPNPLNVNHTHLVNLNTIITYLCKSVCKLELSNKSFTGFFINLILRNEDFNCLITCEHSIDKNRINKKDEVNIIYDSGNKIKEIILDPDERYIKGFSDDYHLDITVIEILPKDNIPKDYFILPNIDFNNNNLMELKHKNVLIMQYASGDLSYSIGGHIMEIKNYEFIFTSISVRRDSIGSPIFLEDSTKVIGVFLGNNQYRYGLWGILIWPIYQYFRNLPENEKISKVYHKLNQQINQNKNKDEAIAVHFISNNQMINYCLPSYPDELFSDVVDKLYEKFPDYKNKSCFFISDGKIMKLNFSMKQNEYKSGDKILVCDN